MPEPKKSRPARNLIEVVALLPWWAGVALALLSYLLLHQIAAQPITADSPGRQVSSMVAQGLWKGLASIGQYLLPVICLAAAGVSAWRRKVRRGLVSDVAQSQASGATGGFLVTSGRFTDEAVRFASGRNVTLVDGPKLVGLIRQARAGAGQAKPRTDTPTATPPAAARRDGRGRQRAGAPADA